MSYVVLARRWRPQKFSDLVGQDVVVRTLKNALASGNLAHAYLLCGIRGVGKTTIARLMAMAINCKKPKGGEPCGACDACTAIAAGSNLDVQEMDAASHTGVDDIREILDGVRYPPTSLKYKVYIIDEAHMLSKNAFNALLKTLEEPPERVMFILATTESEKLPITVRSRCQRFDLRRLGLDEISAYLEQVFKKEKIAHDEQAVSEISRAADGSVRDALSLSERVIAYAGEKLQAEDVRTALGLVGSGLIRTLSDTVFTGDTAAAVAHLRAAMAQGQAPRSLISALGEMWHQLACVKVDENLLDVEPDTEHRQWFDRWVGGLDMQALDLRYQVLVHGLRDMGLMDERRGAEMLLMRLSHLNDLSPVGEMDESSEVQTEKEKHPLNMTRSSATERGHNVQTETMNESGSESAHEPTSEPDLPLHEADEAPGRHFDDWQSVVAAYSEIRPGVAAMLDHVVCVDFGDKVRLALDTHQESAIATPDRMAFMEWLGREVFWESKQDSHEGETLSETRSRQIEAEKERLRKLAEDDPHVQALMTEMDARLVRVRPAGAHEDPASRPE
ncbi:MAG: DNA polymerase III subunit gamma/tau [Mariprofundaceae bacterium]